MKKTKQSLNRFWILTTLVVLVGVGIFMFIRNSMQSATVAMIAENPSSTCTSNLASFTTTGSCGNGLVSRADYVCTESGKKGYEGDGKTCVDPLVAYSHAKSYCGQTCPATSARPSVNPTPTPPVQSARPTPISTAYPSPSVLPTSDPSALPITCNLKTYKRPAGMDGWSESQVINPVGATVNPGEQLAYAVELINPNKYSVGGPLKLYTTNLNGDKEPVYVKSWGGLCQLDNVRKTLSCSEDKFQIDAGSTKGLPSMTIVFEMLSPTLTGIGNTGIIFSGTLGATQFKCEPTTYITINTPTPTPGPGCTMQKKICAKSLIGGTCPPVEVCPNPTTKPTATPTPTPRACAKEMGSCVTKTNTCLTYTDSCAKADFCADPFKICKAPITTNPIPEGCRMEQIQCIKAPCEPVMTCASTTQQPVVVTSRVNRCFKFWNRTICLPTFRR